jgi:hypothetical protein
LTREIDPEAIESGDLTWEEAEYLRVRGKLPEGFEMPEAPEGEEEEEPSEPTSRVTPLEDQTVPVMEDAGGIVLEEDDEGLSGVGSDYSNEEGWNNEKRRAELAKRGLSVAGNKEEMIGRLRRHDSDELFEDDYEQEEAE